MVERRLPARFSLFRMLAGFRAADDCRKMELSVVKTENVKDNDVIPENANSKVLIEYYKNLGRGPL